MGFSNPISVIPFNNEEDRPNSSKVFNR